MRTVPLDLAERLFRVLYSDFDLIKVDGVFIALPSDGAVLAFHGATLAEVVGQIREQKEGGRVPDPFYVNEERALDALLLCWHDAYQVRVDKGQWQAWHCDDPPGSMFTGSTPDELNKKIRADWLGRQ